MINSEIYEGIKNALFGGTSLKEAMQSFYNAGYKKQEIEEAARALVSQPLVIPRNMPKPNIPRRTISRLKRYLITPIKIVQKPLAQKNIIPPKIQTPVQPLQSVKKKFVPKKVFQSISAPNSKSIVPTKTPQRVSAYVLPPKSKSVITLIILIIILILLIGFLAAIFLFKEELVEFFHNLFS